MKTLYVSDLDGTLIQSNEKMSEYAVSTINKLVEKGMLFSYATARSYLTARKVTEGLSAEIPLIVYNGAMVVDNTDGTFLMKNFFEDNAKELLDDLFSFVPDKCTHGMKLFLKSREGDIRTNATADATNLYEGEVFYLSCIDEEDKMRPFYEKYKDRYHCVFQTDIYTGCKWLEIMPKKASKSNAISQLKKYLDCDRLVVFGDGRNDTDMFEIADECYAVSNAVEELKSIATAVIGSNDEDGVARWLKDKLEGDQ